MNSFSKAAFQWKRLKPPVEHFRTGRRSSLLYDAEVLIDHVRTSVESLISGVEAGSRWNYGELCRFRLQDLEKAREAVEGAGVPREEMQQHLAYLSATEEILKQIPERGSRSHGD